MYKYAEYEIPLCEIIQNKIVTNTDIIRPDITHLSAAGFNAPHKLACIGRIIICNNCYDISIITSNNIHLCYVYKQQRKNMLVRLDVMLWYICSVSDQTVGYEAYIGKVFHFILGSKSTCDGT